MRVGVSGLMLLSACSFLGSALCQSSSAPSTTSVNSEKENVAGAESLHADLVLAISDGQNLDDRLPDKILHSYSEDLTTQKVRIRGGGELRIPLSYKAAIARTEDAMKNSGLRVKVEIKASPGKCNIRYRPVIGGAELDAGQTDLLANLDPRWYVFSCDCIVPPIEQRIDCTQDKRIVFRCQR